MAATLCLINKSQMGSMVLYILSHMAILLLLFVIFKIVVNVMRTK